MTESITPAPDLKPNGHNKTIFRTDAVQRYWQEREKIVLPFYLSPKSFLYYWVLLGLLTLVGGLVWTVTFPVYTSGLAVVTRYNDEIVLAIFTSPELTNPLQPNQQLLIQSFEKNETWWATVTDVQPEVLSPQMLQERFANVGTLVTEPAVVTVAEFTPPDERLPPLVYAGSHYTAQIETGSQRIISLMPLIGEFFSQD